MVTSARCRPSDPKSNYRMARETLLDPAHVSPANVVRWRAEDPDLDAAARDYEAALRAGASAPWLDLALLGLGPDGHTASLFPGTSALAEEDRLAVAVDVAQMGTRRLTLTYPALCGAREVCFLVTGPDKAPALATVVEAGHLPAARIVRRAGSRDHILRSATPPAPSPRGFSRNDRSGRRYRGHQRAAGDLRRRPGRRRSAPPLFEKTYPSRAYPSLDVIVDEFAVAATAKIGASAKVAHACFGIAGPIENNMCRATNLPWIVDGRTLASRLGIARVTLVNDFYAAALGVTAVGAGELVAIGGGTPVPHGPIAVLGAGTGLGQAFLLWSAADNAYQVVPSEGGHVDLAARTPLELGLVQFLINKYGRVSCERVLSGHGLVDVFTFLSEEPACRGLIRPDTAAALAAHGSDPAAAISQRALAGTDPICEMALSIFCSVLGATAGNLGLMVLATGGVFVAGGIAPRILSYLQRGGFREAFDRKGRLHTLVERLPVFVVTNAQPGLLGAAKIALTH